ncbi:MAG: FecR domain-containing protein [Desulfobacteraceae bacterium]|nr:FecR domain-containing protein [Desulfobacteraceae bacterium]
MRLNKSIYVVCTVFFFLAGPFSVGNAFSESLIPKGLVIEDIFEPGIGKSVGTVKIVQGTAVIIHSNVSRGYLAKKGLPLFKGDTFITSAKSRARFELEDGSTITLASETKLVISESIYDPSSKSRSSFFRMSIGKARFIVRKLLGFKKSDFEVKTKTAIVGVRGSDFIINASPEQTVVITLENTVLQVTGIADVSKPIMLKDYQKTVVELDALPTDAKEIPIEETERMMREMIIPAERDYSSEDKVRKEEGTHRKYEPQTGEPGEETPTAGTEDADSGQDFDIEPKPLPDEEDDMFKPETPHDFDNAVFPGPPEK